VEICEFQKSFSGINLSWCSGILVYGISGAVKFFDKKVAVEFFKKQVVTFIFGDQTNAKLKVAKQKKFSSAYQLANIQI